MNAFTEHRVKGNRIVSSEIDGENLMWIEVESNGSAIRINVDERDGKIYVTAVDNKLIITPQSSNVIQVEVSTPNQTNTEDTR